MRLTVQRYELADPTWTPHQAAKPNDEVTLEVTARDITASQIIEFRIMRGAELLDVLESQPGKRTAVWRVPNLPGDHDVTFVAIRREKASPENGHSIALATVTSPVLKVQGFSLKMETVGSDQAFVPFRESLHVKYTVTDPLGGARAGRYEVWGERYPGPDPQPLYTTDFVPAAGATTWQSWLGGARAGVLAGQWLTPEFSPYRLRIWIGPNQGAVADPNGAGAGLVACAEWQFEVKFQSIEIRLQAGVAEKAADAAYQFASTLMIAPPDVHGVYAATGRLPTTAETMRLRVPVARHQAISDPLNQDWVGVNSDYMAGNKKTKWATEQDFYSRPELPLEFVLKLASRDPATNPQGLFEKRAVGAAIVEPVAEERCEAALFAPANNDQHYWTNAAFKVKKGMHKSPWHGANNLPEYHYWMARLVVAADGDRDFDVTTFDANLGYRDGQGELVVYLNRTRLTLSTAADDTELDAKLKDYREITGGPPATQIKLRKDLTKAGDILWVIRKDSTAAGNDIVANWQQFPPGPNCHVHYGGVRGEVPTAQLSNYFRDSYSSSKGKHKPIIGLANAKFPYQKYVNLKPDQAAVKDQERVEVTAMPADPQRGLAGVLFSPSFVAGDSYILHAWMEREAYLRRFGFIEEKPALKQRTGNVTIWRWARIHNSYRLPDIGTNGLAATVGGDPENAVGVGWRDYDGNGVNMYIGGADPLSLATQYAPAFTEWSLAAPAGYVPGAGDDAIHQSVDLAKYRQAHNAATAGWKGRFPMGANGDIKNYSVAWDYYRAQLPPGLPNLPKLIANTIAGQLAGTSTHDVADAVALAVTGVAVDVAALDPGVRVIPPFPQDIDHYTRWFDGKWDEVQGKLLDALTPRVTNPDQVNVVRWPTLHEHDAWNGYDTGTDTAQFNTMMTLGFSRGDGQSMFRTANLSVTTPRAAVHENTFPHEMGHATNLVHFVAENVAWKHHDVNNPDCLMSYDYTTGFIMQATAAVVAHGPGGVGAVGPVGGAATNETGFPDTVPVDNPPGAPFPSPAQGATAAHSGQDCIWFRAPLAPLNLCAKCILKIRGWKDDVLPFAWLHPDLF
jgi:hypothetical protein